jgi:hypothetical protein
MKVEPSWIGPQKVLLPFSAHEDTRRRQQSTMRRRALTEQDHVGTLMFHSPELWQIHFCSLSHVSSLWNFCQSSPNGLRCFLSHFLISKSLTIRWSWVSCVATAHILLTLLCCLKHGWWVCLIFNPAVYMSLYFWWLYFYQVPYHSYKNWVLILTIRF